MASDVLLFSLLTLILLLSAVAGFALGAWRQASASTRRSKQPPTSPATPPSETPSESRMARLAADQAELFSTLEKLTTTVKRLSSRQGMRDARERDAAEASNSAPPVGTSKADLLRHYGMSGKVGPAFAQAQLELEHSRERH